MAASPAPAFTDTPRFDHTALAIALTGSAAWLAVGVALIAFLNGGL